MLPEDLFKRRHYGTPQSLLLIVANFTVFCLSASIFAICDTVSWVFWTIMGLLAIYNVINLRKDREEYTRARIIAYVISIIIMIVMFVLFRSRPQTC
jgi:heme O synthase-like polyprenyltransferase